MITVSVGVGTAEPPFDGDGQHLVDAADEALYRAKRDGRGRAAGQRVVLPASTSSKA